MKQTVIDILIYLFENYVDDEIELDSDGDRLRSELSEAGFEAGQVTKAFDWLQELAVQQDTDGTQVAAAATSMRVYSVEEQQRLDAECRGFLYFLEQSGVLDPYCGNW